MQKRKRVLFVCKGNMCRSPMGEAWAKAKLGHVVEAESAGVSAYAGTPAASHAVAVAKRVLGHDLGMHRARSIDDLDLASFDLVVGMTGGIADELKGRVTGGGTVVVALEIPDPYLETMDVYEETMAEIGRQLEKKLVPLLRIRE